MAYKINFETYSSHFVVPQRLIEDDFAQMDGTYLKVILLIFQNADKNYSANLISNLLGISEAKVREAIRYFVKKGLLLDQKQEKIEPDVIVFPKKNTPVPEGKGINKSELSFLLECMENLLKRPVTSVEYKSVIHILEFIKLPADVVLMAIEYCISIDKMNARYMEKVCATWSDSGITTHELAEQYLNLLKQSKQNEAQIKKLFGIQNRNLIDSERDYINRWFHVYHFDLEVIKMAYERTITAISKLSFPYLNKILASWSEKGYTNAEDIALNEGLSRKSSTASYDIDELDRYWDNVPKLE